jgi:putative ABC transport system permease protein
MSDLIQLDFGDLGWALGLIAIALLLSRWQNLALENQLLIASVRSILQLLMVGYILEFIFALNNPVAVIGILGIMLTIAAIVARNRIKLKHPRSKKPHSWSLITDHWSLITVWVSIFISTFLTISYSIILIIQPVNWYEPQYLIPLTGMVLGNAMNGAALAGERLVSKINNSHLEIETYLSLGATPKLAIASYRQEAIRAALIPTINTMMVVGLVSLPGMFTGQVLAGNLPLDAVSYQILILFMIAIANLMTSILVTEGIYRSFFNQDLQLIHSL